MTTTRACAEAILKECGGSIDPWSNPEKMAVLERHLQAHAEEAAHAAAEACAETIESLEQAAISAGAGNSSYVLGLSDASKRIRTYDSTTWLLHHDAQVELEEHIALCRNLVSDGKSVNIHLCGCKCGCNSKCSRRLELESHPVVR